MRIRLNQNKGMFKYVVVGMSGKKLDVLVAYPGRVRWWTVVLTISSFHLLSIVNSETPRAWSYPYATWLTSILTNQSWVFKTVTDKYSELKVHFLSDVEKQKCLFCWYKLQINLYYIEFTVILRKMLASIHGILSFNFIIFLQLSVLHFLNNACCSGSTIVGIGSPDPPQFIYDDEEYKDVFLSGQSHVVTSVAQPLDCVRNLFCFFFNQLRTTI